MFTDRTREETGRILRRITRLRLRTLWFDTMNKILLTLENQTSKEEKRKNVESTEEISGAGECRREEYGLPFPIGL